MDAGDPGPGAVQHDGYARVGLLLHPCTGQTCMQVRPPEVHLSNK